MIYFLNVCFFLFEWLTFTFFFVSLLRALSILYLCIKSVYVRFYSVQGMCFFFDLPCIQSVPTHFKKIGYPSDFQCRSSYLLMPSPISVFSLFSANSTRHFQPISKTMRSFTSCCSLFAIYVTIVS